MLSEFTCGVVRPAAPGRMRGGGKCCRWCCWSAWLPSSRTASSDCGWPLGRACQGLQRGRQLVPRPPPPSPTGAAVPAPCAWQCWTGAAHAAFGTSSEWPTSAAVAVPDCLLPPVRHLFGHLNEGVQLRSAMESRFKRGVKGAVSHSGGNHICLQYVCVYVLCLYFKADAFDQQSLHHI